MIVAEAKRTKPRFATHIDRARHRVMLNNFEYGEIIDFADIDLDPVETEDEAVYVVYRMRNKFAAAPIDELETLTVN
jgi:hypothetical protein